MTNKQLAEAARLVAVTSSTPSDRRGLANFRADIRRAERNTRTTPEEP